jgi:hypothetical protein
VTVHAWTDLPVLLSRLDQCLAAAVPHARARYGIGPGADPYRGLYIGDDLVDDLVRQTLEGPSLWDAVVDTWPQLTTEVCSEPLDPFDTAVVMLSLAPDIDLKYERIYGYLQDDVNARRPRVSLALDLFCGDLQSRLAARDRFSPDAPLRREKMVRLGGSDDLPLLARPLRLEPQLIRHLVGGTGLDERVASCCEVVLPDLEKPRVPLDDIRRARMRELTESVAAGHPVRVALVGDDLEVLGDLAAEIAAAAELPILRMALRANDDLLPVVSLESRLLGYAVHIEWSQDVQPPSAAELDELAAAGEVVVVTTDRASREFEALGFGVVEINRPDAALRRHWWQRCAAGLDASDIDRLAARYRLTGTQIRAASRAAAAVSAPVGHVPASPDPDLLAAAARRQSRHRLEGLARLVDSTATWDDLVLPPAAIGTLRELCDRITHRQTVLRQWGMDRRTNGRIGVNALFAGPSGTGKTMAAQAIAGELGLDLFAVDLPGVVNKYIGETEKNLDAIFTAAESTDAIVLFDEADALFGKRSEVRDSHDRYANLEISYLLQRMEAHDGITLLATNLRQNLDDAFLRRLGFVVRFPFPEEAERRRIWANIWPGTVPVDADVDLDVLAHRYRFSGGNIRNIAVCAAFLAAAQERVVSWEDVMTAVDREYEKLGGAAVPSADRLTAASN